MTFKTRDQIEIPDDPEEQDAENDQHVFEELGQRALESICDQARQMLKSRNGLYRETQDLKDSLSLVKRENESLKKKLEEGFEAGRVTIKCLSHDLENTRAKLLVSEQAEHSPKGRPMLL